MCTGKTPACVQHKRAFCQYTRRRFERTHGGVWNSTLGGASLSLSSCPLFRRSLPSFSSLRSLLSSLLSPLLSATMTMITRPIGSLCVHTALTCESVGVRGLWLIPCLANMFASCKKQLSWYNCASLVPLGVKWVCICAGNG